MSWVVGGVALVTIVAAFMGARRLATSLDWSQRKIFLYVMTFGGVFALVGANKYVNDAFLITSFLVIIVAYFAMLTAPDKS